MSLIKISGLEGKSLIFIHDDELGREDCKRFNEIDLVFDVARR